MVFCLSVMMWMNREDIIYVTEILTYVQWRAKCIQISTVVFCSSSLTEGQTLLLDMWLVWILYIFISALEFILYSLWPWKWPVHALCWHNISLYPHYRICFQWEWAHSTGAVWRRPVCCHRTCPGMVEFKTPCYRCKVSICSILPKYWALTDLHQSIRWKYLKLYGK